MCHLKVGCVLRTFKPNVCVTNGILSPFPQRQGDVGLACGDDFQQPLHLPLLRGLSAELCVEKGHICLGPQNAGSAWQTLI